MWLFLPAVTLTIQVTVIYAMPHRPFQSKGSASFANSVHILFAIVATQPQKDGSFRPRQKAWSSTIEI